MKLYEIIAREFSDDENYKKLGEVLCTNPVEVGVAEHVYREAFMNSVGYDPTTVYDEERIRRYYGDNKHRFNIPADKTDSEMVSEIVTDYKDRKDKTVEAFTESYLTTNYWGGNNGIFNADDDDDDEEDEDIFDSKDDLDSFLEDDDDDDDDSDDVEYFEF